MIDQLRTKLQDKLGRDFGYRDLKKIENDGGPTASCIGNWFWGKTQRPQNATIEATGRAIGVMRVWVPLKLKDGPKKPKSAKKRTMKKQEG